MAGSLHHSVRRAAAAVLALTLISAFLVFAPPAASAEEVLTIDKSAPNLVAPGERLTYSIVVTNVVGAKVTDVVMTDVIQHLEGFDGTERLDITSSGSSSTSGSCGQTGNTVTCSKGTMRGFEAWTITISGYVTAPDGTTINNTAFVAGTKSAQQHQASDTVQTRVDLRAGGALPDLSAAVKGPNTTRPSGDVVYTVTASNFGSAPASDVVLTVTMPNSVTFVASEATSLFNCNLDLPQTETTTLTCTGGAINDGQNATVQVGVVAPDPFDQPISVTAAVDPFDAIFESNEENNFANATTADVGTAPPTDLLLDKTDSKDPIAPGEQLTYTIRLENVSPDRADYIEVIDGTQGLEASSVSASAVITNAPNNSPAMTCTVQAPTVSCTTTRFQPGAIATITIKGIVIAKPGSVILNTATVNGNIRNTGVTHTASTITVVRPSIDLTVTQHRTLPAIPAPVRAADRFDYTITVGNSGLYDANNVIVRQPLPAGIVPGPKDDVYFDGFAASVLGTTCAVDALTNVLTCTIPKVEGSVNSPLGGGTETITLFLIAPHRIGQITSTVTVDPANIIKEDDETNNTYTTTTDVLTGIDLIVSKTDTPDPVARNGTLRYTITVSNIGTQDAEGVVIRDVMPEGAVFRTATDTSPFHNFTCRQDGVNAVVCEAGRINGTYSGSLTQPVDFAVIHLDVFAPDEPDGTGIYHNEVRVDPFNTIPEKNETNNLHLETTTVENTHTGAGMYKELYIDKLDEVSPDLPPYATNGMLDYDLVVANAGESAVGSTDQLVVRAALPQGSRYRNAYDMLGSGQGSFTCSYLPGSHQVECFGGTVDSLGTRAIRIETFAPNAQGDALIQAMVDPGNNILEADEGNNSADEKTVIQAGEEPAVQGVYIDLKVNDIVDSHDPVGTSSTLDYAVSIANLGAADAFAEDGDKQSGVTFAATLPTGAVFRSADDSADDTDPADAAAAFTCTESGGVVTCTGGRINAGGARVVNIRVFAPENPTTSDPLTRAHLVVQVDPTNIFPEGHEGNNSAEEFTDVTINGPGGYVDLKVAGTAAIDSKSSTEANEVIPGGKITYELTITNDGTQDAINVALRDWLPAGMSFVSATSDVLSVDGDDNFFACGHANGVIDCTGGYVRGTASNSGAPGTRKITVIATAPLVAEVQIVNQAKVDPGELVAEQSEINNVGQITNQVKSIVDLVVTMQDGGTSTSGDEGHWTLTATNTMGSQANSRANNVVLVANFSGGTIHIDTATTNRTGWNCSVYENPVNQVRCVGNFQNDEDDVTVDVHYFRTSDDPVHSYAEIDPEEDTSDAIVGRSVEVEEYNNIAEGDD